MPATQKDFVHCVLPSLRGREAAFRAPKSELLFLGILRGLFAEGLLPNGAVLDAGANDGVTACVLATLASPAHKVYAIDPTPANLQHMRQAYGKTLPNLVPQLGVLGSRRGTVRLGNLSSQVGAQLTVSPDAAAVHGAAQPPTSAATVEVLSTDDLFAARQGRGKLGFAHWDVEGYEARVIRGSLATLKRDRPVFSAELHVHQDSMFSRQLLELTASLGYAAWLVEEICGLFADCRNLLFLPREQLHSRFAGSATLDVAMISRAMIRVDADNISSLAFPCCRAGRECCRAGRLPGRTTSRAGCCNHQAALEWAASHVRTSNDSRFDPRLATAMGGRLSWPSHPFHVLVDA